MPNSKAYEVVEQAEDFTVSYSGLNTPKITADISGGPAQSAGSIEITVIVGSALHVFHILVAKDETVSHIIDKFLLTSSVPAGVTAAKSSHNSIEFDVTSGESAFAVGTAWTPSAPVDTPSAPGHLPSNAVVGGGEFTLAFTGRNAKSADIQMSGGPASKHGSLHYEIVVGTAAAASDKTIAFELKIVPGITAEQIVNSISAFVSTDATFAKKDAATITVTTAAAADVVKEIHVWWSEDLGGGSVGGIGDGAGSGPDGGTGDSSTGTLPTGTVTTSKTQSTIVIGGVHCSTRPDTLDGCFSSWSEQDGETVIRSEMDDGTVKLRRRFTGIRRYAAAAVTLKAADVKTFMEWYRVWCLHGVYPSFYKEPDGTEAIWRLTQAPRIQWITKDAATITVSLERHPSWL